jgi:hypothetical protein
MGLLWHVLNSWQGARQELDSEMTAGIAALTSIEHAAQNRLLKMNAIG